MVWSFVFLLLMLVLEGMVASSMSLTMWAAEVLLGVVWNVCFVRCESVWEFSNRSQQVAWLVVVKIKNLAAVSFPSCVVDHIRFCHLNFANKISCFDLVNNFWFDKLVCMIKWVKLRLENCCKPGNKNAADFPFGCSSFCSSMFAWFPPMSLLAWDVKFMFLLSSLKVWMLDQGSFG